MSYGWVELGDAQDGFCHSRLEILLGGKVFLTVGLKPGTVVVGGYVTQKRKDEPGVHVMIDYLRAFDPSMILGQMDSNSHFSQCGARLVHT
jgi:hypothetical protein